MKLAFMTLYNKIGKEINAINLFSTYKRDIKDLFVHERNTFLLRHRWQKGLQIIIFH